MVAVKIQTAHTPLIVLGIYRPTDNNADYSTSMCDAISSIARKFPNSPLWIAGDTNLPDIDWKTSTVLKHQYTKQINELFLDTFSMLGLSQMVTFQTRLDNILDIFLTNRPSLVNRCEPVPGVSDHDVAVYVNSDILPKRQRPIQRKIHIWRKADTEQIQEELATFADEMQTQHNPDTPVETLWALLTAKCQNVLSNHVPTRLSSQRYNQPWANGIIRNLSRKKKKYFKKAQRTKSACDMAKYREIKKLAQSECRKAYYGYINSMIGENNKNEGNLKKFWSFIKSKKKDNSGVAPLTKNGIVHSDSQTKADILNMQFSSVFTDGDTNNVLSLGMSPYSDFPHIRVSEAGVRKLLEAVKPHKATGPDGIPARLLKDYAAELAPVLTLIYQASLNQGTVPADWKHAWVIPVYKKGTRTTASNYRPISLTSISCKTLEHIVHSNLMDHLEQHNILSDYQHGFRKRRSCETQLIQAVDDLAMCLNEGGQIDAVLLDFSKAFDKVSHHHLATKLHHYGVRGKMLDWVKSFLSSRTQEVILEGKRSSSAAVTSGVPQGSVLGPILFLCYINDLPDQVSSTVRLFADDCLLYRNINSRDDADKLQDDIYKLQMWEKNG